MNKQRSSQYSQAFIETKHQLTPDASWILQQKKHIIDHIEQSQRTEEFDSSFIEKSYTFFSFFIPRPLVAVARPMLVVFMSFGILLGGWGVRVASANSIPGELLYNVKRADEYAQLILTTDPKEKVKKNLAFAVRRNNEIGELLDQKSDDQSVSEQALDHVEKNVASLEKNIKSAEETVKQLDGTTLEPTDVLAVAVEFSITAKEISTTLAAHIEHIEQQVTPPQGDVLSTTTISDGTTTVHDQQVAAIIEKTEQTAAIIDTADITVISHAVTTIVDAGSVILEQDQNKDIVVELVAQKAASLVAQVEHSNTLPIGTSSLENTVITSLSTSTSPVLDQLIQTVSTTAMVPDGTATQTIMAVPYSSSTPVSDLGKKIVEEVQGLAETNLLNALEKVIELQKNVQVPSTSIIVPLPSSEVVTPSQEEVLPSQSQ